MTSTRGSNPWVQTYRGIHFDLTDPDPEKVDITDIAHSLARLNRFNGHGKRYSVAQHSLFVSSIVPPELEYEGLLHDAHEAYLGDISAPLKRLLPELREYEKRLSAIVRGRFGLPETLSEEVKEADLKALMIEKIYNFNDQMDWELPSVTLTRSDYLRYGMCSLEKAESMFLVSFWRNRRSLCM